MEASVITLHSAIQKQKQIDPLIDCIIDIIWSEEAKWVRNIYFFSRQHDM